MERRASFEVRGSYFGVHRLRGVLAKGPEVPASHALSRGSHPQEALVVQFALARTPKQPNPIDGVR
jgi:hypothetical protein